MFKIRNIVAMALLALSPVAVCEEFTPPPHWEGSDAESATAAAGQDALKPVWQAAQVWPDDPFGSANYVPLTWAAGVGGEAWRAVENEHGGAPRIAFSPGMVFMSARSPWVERPGQKLPALIFSAPKPGKYKVDGEVRARFFSGKEPIDFRVLLRNSSEVRDVAALQLSGEDTEPAMFDKVEATLQAGEELVFVPHYRQGMNQGVDVQLVDLRITLVQ